MKKTTFVAVCIVIILIVIGFNRWSSKGSQSLTSKSQDTPQYLNVSYAIGAQNVLLQNGVSEVTINPTTNAKIITKYFGNDFKGDINGDGKEDAVFFVTQQTGGSGTLYYVVAALKTDTGYKGINGVLLGDRIAPQNIQFSSGVVAVNYADRKPGEPMTQAPSVGLTKFLVLDGLRLAELTIGEGEKLLGGSITIGNEVREFKPCGESALWLMPSSPAYKMISSLYSQSVSTTSKPYTPVFSIVIGKTVPAPKDGFGADYKQAFSVTQLVNMNPNWKCN